MVHVKFIETCGQKKTNRKRCLESKDRRQGMSAGEKEKVRNKCRRKGEGVPKRGVGVAYTMALMTSKIYDAGWGYSRDILV